MMNDEGKLEELEKMEGEKVRRYEGEKRKR